MKKILFNTFILGSITLFIYLALWQVERLRWKNSLINQLDKYKDTEYVDFDSRSFNQNNDLFKKVNLYGSFLHENEILLHAKYLNSERKKKEIGYHVITPFVTTDGTIVLVNRGWVPEEYKTINDRTESRVQNNIDQPVQGIIRKSKGKAPWFMPKNMPEKDVWFWANIPEIIDRLKATTELENIKPVYVQQTNLTTYNDFQYPIPVSENIEFYNQHLTYVITWFSLAFITALMWFFWLRSEEKKKSSTLNQP
jgi:surfeit locus 1 family protein